MIEQRVRMEGSPYNKIVQRIKQHGVSYKIEQLCLDEINLVLFTQQICNVIDSCSKIQHLSLCNCQLSSLIYFPQLPNLFKLQLSFNNLQSDHLEPLLRYPKLYSLSLDNNLIKDFTWTRFLKRSRLAILSLRQNAITLEANYRQRVYKFLGADLDVLDGIDRKGNYTNQNESSFQEDSEEENAQSGYSEQQGESQELEGGEDSLHKKIKSNQQSQK